MNFGVSYLERGDYANAELYLLEGLALARQLGYEDMICAALINLISLLGRRGEYERAATYFEEARERALKMKDRWFISELSRFLGEIYLAQHQYAQANAVLQEGLKYTSEVAQTKRMLKVRAQSQFDLACIALAQGKIVEARHLGKLSLAFLEESGHYWSARVRQWLEQLPPEG